MLHIIFGDNTNYEAPHHRIFSILLLAPSLIQKFSSALCSSLRVRKKVSHSYTTADKLIIQYILIFRNLEEMNYTILN
jgi:hypothetical protein